MPISEAVHDTFRVNFYKDYIKSLIDAITLDGINVKGYFGWSLMDNFEWADGYSVRFGMTYVDYKDNQKRYIKDSLIWYSSFSKTGDINAKLIYPINRVYPPEMSEIKDQNDKDIDSNVFLE